MAKKAIDEESELLARKQIPYGGLTIVPSLVKPNKLVLFQTRINEIQMARRRVISDALVLGQKIARGNNGTIVYQGIYLGRPVAVKRLQKGFHDDSIEIKCLLSSYNHPNVIRYYGMEEDDNFIYLVLELCDVSLSHFVNKNKNIKLWLNRFPLPELLVLMRGIVAGIAHLHSLGFVHRKLRASNVLMVDLCPKLSGMGSCRLLAEDESLPGHDGLVARKLPQWKDVNNRTSGYGGWLAPEHFLNEPQTRAVDLFSLGCVLFFCLTRGKHPFGDYFKRDYNVVHGCMRNLFYVDHIPEALDLFPQLLSHTPKIRPKASEVLSHPLFWFPKMRLSFLSDVGKWLETEHKKDNIILEALEKEGRAAFTQRGDDRVAFKTWDGRMGRELISQMTQRKKYDYNMVGDLLRFIQDTQNCYYQLPENIQDMLGAMPEGVDMYFRIKFPKLLMKVYIVMQLHCKQEDWLDKYLKNYM